MEWYVEIYKRTWPRSALRAWAWARSLKIIHISSTPNQALRFISSDTF
jgi:hypothetical protein